MDRQPLNRCPFDPSNVPDLQRDQVAFANTLSALLGANARPPSLGDGAITFSSGTPHPRNANGSLPDTVLLNILRQRFIVLDSDTTRSGFHEPGGGLPSFDLISTLLATAQHGNVVYTQERMERNATDNAPGPASAEAMATLPKVKVSKEMLGDDGKAECSICMEEVLLGNEVMQLYCKHWFHEQCVKAWLSEHDTCPQCRKGISEISQQQQQGPPASSDQHRISASVSRSAPGAFSDNIDHSRRSNASWTRWVSDHRPRRRTSGTGGGSGSGWFLDRARSFFGMRP